MLHSFHPHGAAWRRGAAAATSASADRDPLRSRLRLRLRLRSRGYRVFVYRRRKHYATALYDATRTTPRLPPSSRPLSSQYSRPVPFYSEEGEEEERISILETSFPGCSIGARRGDSNNTRTHCIFEVTFLFSLYHEFIKSSDYEQQSWLM